VTGDVEAKLVVLACSDPPDGYDRWTLKLLSDRLVELEVIESVSPVTVHRRSKNALKPWRVSSWCIGKPSGKFVSKMEDVLDVYQRPYDPARPVGSLYRVADSAS
jgi:hypothetical protein